MQIKIPKPVDFILSKLNNSGFEAYIVGGCVRDSILGITPHDWDICTSATPNEVIDVFRDETLIPTGLKHGTITAIIGREPFEITTFRTESAYSDNRHPDKVSFVSDIKEDLSRRDLTINAMAYNPNTGIIDFFDGTNDLKNKIIKCVGNPDTRFNEDALRILRTLRFASVFGFQIDQSTSESVFKNKNLLSNISKERIRSEFVKLLSGKNATDIISEYRSVIAHFIPEIEPTFDFPQNNKYHCFDVFNHTMQALKSYTGDDQYVRLAIFFHDIGKPESYIVENGDGHFYGHADVGRLMTDNILRRLKFDNETIKNVCELVAYHDFAINPSTKAVKRLLNKIGEEQFSRLLDVKKSDILAKSDFEKDKNISNLSLISQIFDEIIKESSCFSIKDLDVSGTDIMNLGFRQGPQIGQILNDVLNSVMDGETENEKTKIIEYVEENYSL